MSGFFCSCILTYPCPCVSACLSSSTMDGEACILTGDMWAIPLHTKMAAALYTLL